MNLDSTDVDPGRLLGSGDEVMSVAAGLLAQIDAFERDLAGLGTPWGNDGLGSLIGEGYRAISAYAFETYRENAEDMLDTGGALRAMATNYRVADQAAADRLDGVAETLD